MTALLALLWLVVGLAAGAVWLVFVIWLAILFAELGVFEAFAEIGRWVARL